MTTAPTVTGQPVLLLLRDSQVLPSLPKPLKAGPRHLVLLCTFKSLLLNKQVKHYVQEHVLFLSWHLTPSNTHTPHHSPSLRRRAASHWHPPATRPCPQVGTESEGKEGARATWTLRTASYPSQPLPTTGLALPPGTEQASPRGRVSAGSWEQTLAGGASDPVRPSSGR